MPKIDLSALFGYLCYGSRTCNKAEREKNMPKLNFSGYLPNTIRNNILKLPVIPAGAFSVIQDGVQDGRQNVETAIYRLVINITL